MASLISPSISQCTQNGFGIVFNQETVLSLSFFDFSLSSPFHYHNGGKRGLKESIWVHLELAEMEVCGHSLAPGQLSWTVPVN